MITSGPLPDWTDEVIPRLNVVGVDHLDIELDAECLFAFGDYFVPQHLIGGRHEIGPPQPVNRVDRRRLLKLSGVGAIAAGTGGASSCFLPDNPKGFPVYHPSTITVILNEGFGILASGRAQPWATANMGMEGCRTANPWDSDDVPGHPYAVAMETVHLAPNAEVSLEENPMPFYEKDAFASITERPAPAFRCWSSPVADSTRRAILA
jgi:hypothetical protein